MKLLYAGFTFLLLGCVAFFAFNHSSARSVKDNNSTSILESQPLANESQPPAKSVSPEHIKVAVEKGAKWLASVQGSDGGWGQDGGEVKFIRDGERLESKGNDVANTAVAALALMNAGKQYQPNVERAIGFILKKIESAPPKGLSITDVNQTQIQRKLGPYIDTFLASMVLAKADGTIAGIDKTKLRSGLEKCIAKIEANQKGDGSWNLAGGWAPILGTSLASRSLYEAKRKGVKVNDKVMENADNYTVKAQKASAGSGSSALSSVRSSAETVEISASSAGVDLYKDAQALEQLSRDENSRTKNKEAIDSIKTKISNERFVDGFGSIGGEEFFSYLNISESLKRTGGKEWNKWHSNISSKILKTQNNDGTWAGHHCITGRVAVTAAAMLNLVPSNEK